MSCLSCFAVISCLPPLNMCGLKSFHNDELNNYLNVCSDFLLLQTLSEWPRTLRCPKWMNAKCCFTWCFPDLHWEVVDGTLGKEGVMKCWPWKAYHAVGTSSLFPASCVDLWNYTQITLGKSVFYPFWSWVVCGHQPFDVLGIVCHRIMVSLKLKTTSNISRVQLNATVSTKP